MESAPSGPLPGRSLLADEGRFDVRAYARDLQGSLRDGIDVDALAGRPLPASALGALKLLQGAERGTMSRLRNILVTPTHKDPRVTAFLSAWAFEKYWIADALDAVLQASGGPGEPPATVPVRRERTLERLRPLGHSLTGNLIGADIVAVHVTLAAVDEWVTSAWYERIDELAGRAELTSVLARIDMVKGRHEQFFATEARARLDGSPRPQRITRRRLRSARFPFPGPGTAPARAEAVRRELFGSGTAHRERLAGRIRSLPGQSAVADVVAARA